MYSAPEPALIWPLERACGQMRPPGVQESPLFHCHAKISTQSGSWYSARHNLCHVQTRLKDCTCPSVPEHLCPFPRALGFPGGSDDKESAWNARDLGLISGSGRSPGEEGGNPLRYSCLKNPKIPWTEEPAELQCAVSQRGGHDWGTNTFTMTSWTKRNYIQITNLTNIFRLRRYFLSFCV